MPCGDSRTRANKLRALSSKELVTFPEVSLAICADNFSSSAITHEPRACKIRLDISAAAALVKVRHKILPGSTPCNNKLRTRLVSKLVFPEPAFAVTNTQASVLKAIFAFSSPTTLTFLLSI